MFDQCFYVLLAICLLPAPAVAGPPVVIAHRGASGYLPEHTLPAKALAHAMGADYIEQDVVLTKDKVPVVLHDIHLDTVTNVAKVFPNRARADGRFYALDFTLYEIKKLNVHERIDIKTGAAVYPRRFPVGKSVFGVPTLAEEIELIQGLDQSTGRKTGIYPEIKQPTFHREAGYDISKIVLQTLTQYKYRSKSDHCIVQCFDQTETRRLRDELGCELPLIQLLGKSDWSKPAGYLVIDEVKEKLSSIAEYADGIGPPTSQLIANIRNGRLAPSPLLKGAQASKLMVHPYTLRADDLPSYANSMEEMTHMFFHQLKVDGLFTDFPDLAIRARDKKRP